MLCSPQLPVLAGDLSGRGRGAPQGRLLVQAGKPMIPTAEPKQEGALLQVGASLHQHRLHERFLFIDR